MYNVKINDADKLIDIVRELRILNYLQMLIYDDVNFYGNHEDCEFTRMAEYYLEKKSEKTILALSELVISDDFWGRKDNYYN